MIDPATLGAFAAVAGVGLALVGHVIKYAYDKGRSDNRLDNLEKGQAGATEVQTLLSAMSSTVSALGKSVDRLDSALDRVTARLFTGREQ